MKLVKINFHEFLCPWDYVSDYKYLGCHAQNWVYQLGAVVYRMYEGLLWWLMAYSIHGHICHILEANSKRPVFLNLFIKYFQSLVVLKIYNSIT